ncbi:uncharacterized protein LOC144984205 isoform X2 [Oryzias latipes]
MIRLIQKRRGASDAHFQPYLLEGLVRWNDEGMEDAVKGNSSFQLFETTMREAVEQLSQTELGSPGMSVIVLLEHKWTPEEDRLLERVDEQDFQDTMEDITVPVLDDPHLDVVASPSSSPQPRPHLESQSTETESSPSDEAEWAVVGPDGIAGWDKVQDLASYSVGLRKAPYLTDPQVTEAIGSWTALLDVDKERVNYQPRHQPELTHGRFKAPKRSGVTPGVESVKRCLSGHPGGPAQWPSTSRLVQFSFICIAQIHNMLRLYASSLADYMKLPPKRLEVVQNPHGLLPYPGFSAEADGSMIQLFELNQRKLLQWFQRRQKNQEMRPRTLIDSTRASCCSCKRPSSSKG